MIEIKFLDSIFSHVGYYTALLHYKSLLIHVTFITLVGELSSSLLSSFTFLCVFAIFIFNFLLNEFSYWCVTFVFDPCIIISISIFFDCFDLFFCTFRLCNYYFFSIALTILDIVFFSFLIMILYKYIVVFTLVSLVIDMYAILFSIYIRLLHFFLLSPLHYLLWWSMHLNIYYRGYLSKITLIIPYSFSSFFFKILIDCTLFDILLWSAHPPSPSVLSFYFNRIIG